MEMDNDAEAPQATPLTSFIELRDEDLPEKGDEPLTTDLLEKDPPEKGEEPEPTEGNINPGLGWKEKLALGAGFATVGVLTGPAVAAGIFYYGLGLSSAGPVAGGLFASYMGSGVVAGSSMAILQSVAMTPVLATGGASVGAVAGVGTGYLGADYIKAGVVTGVETVKWWIWRKD